MKGKFGINAFGKIYNLGMLWLKYYELCKLDDLEKRLIDLEEESRRRGGL